MYGSGVMTGIQDMRARAVLYEVAVGSATSTSVRWLIVASTTRTTVTAIAGFAWQEVFKVFEFLEFGIWKSCPRSE